MGTTSFDLLVPLDRSRARGLRAQIEDELRQAIRSGRLAAGTPLPSSRALAADLGVTRGVVVDAYDQLVAEGYLVARPGSGTVVNDDAAPRDGHAARSAPAPVAVDVDFRPSLPDLSLFPRSAWSRATRTALQAMPDTELGYGDQRGLPLLRSALADYLARVRGVCAEPDQVIVCAGYSHGFHLVTGALRAMGREDVAVEDPGYEGPREELAAAGIRTHAVLVDSDGIDVDDLHRTPARVVAVTPAHQSPTGVVLSADRRRRLVEWAHEVDGYVIEDDYDAEYRYDRRPVGALQGIAPERVVYAGTASKSLAPGLRLGWLVVPQALVEPIVERRKSTDGTTSSVLQATYAAFLEAGDLDRHLRRTRRAYRVRRDALVDALRRWLPDAEPTGIAAGLHVLVRLPGGVDEIAVAERALEVGVRTYPLATYRSGRWGGPPGVVLGYGSVPPARAELGVQRLAQVVDELR